MCAEQVSVSTEWFRVGSAPKEMQLCGFPLLQVGKAIRMLKVAEHVNFPDYHLR